MIILILFYSIYLIREIILFIASSHQIFQKCQNFLIFCVGILYFLKNLMGTSNIFQFNFFYYWIWIGVFVFPFYSNFVVEIKTKVSQNELRKTHAKINLKNKNGIHDTYKIKDLC
jgi:hypothetical protein